MRLRLLAFSFWLLTLGFVLPVYADWTPPQFAPPNCPAGVAGCDGPLTPNQDADVGNLIAWSSASTLGPLSVFSSGSKLVQRFLVSAVDEGAGVLSLFSPHGAETVRLITEGDSYFTSGRLGLGTAAPVATLDVLGTFHFDDAQNPVAAGYVLTADDFGNASWQAPSGGGLGSGTDQPRCDSNLRGTLWFTPGDSRVKDRLELCAKDGSDGYGWSSLY